MEKLQIFLRDLGRWSIRKRLHVGYEEHWKLDKTTDSAKNIEINVTGAEEPPFGIGDWVRILYIDNETDPATYNTDGTPDNHSQYIIGGIKKTYDATTNIWTCGMELLEPIERARGIMGETLTYTNQTSKIYNDVTYVKEPYNHLTALERWLKVTPANCDTYEEGYDPHKNISWYNRIKILDKDFLEKIPFADTTYNELSLYNVLLDNFDSSAGRTPVLYFDIDPETDLPRNMARDEYLLKFERQDGLGEDPIDYDALLKNADNVCISETIDNYATGLVANVENLSAGGSVSFPAQGLYAVPEVDADVRNTSVSPYDETGSDYWVLRVPFPIKSVNLIQELEFLSFSATGDHYNTHYRTKRTNNIFRKDIVLEKKQYLSLDPEDPTEPNEKLQYFWYEEGKNTIHINKYFYKFVNDNTSSFMYYIEYEPLIDCRLQVGDENFIQQFNQSSSQVDGEKFGAFMQAFLKGMHKPDITFGKNYHDPRKFKGYIGRRVVKGDKTYLITNISYRNRVYDYYVAFQLNENHVRKNTSYQVSQEIRPNIAIPTDSIKERKTVLRQKVKIGMTPQTKEGPQYLARDCDILTALDPGGFSIIRYPQVAMIEAKSKLIQQDGTVFNFSQKRLAPIARFVFGNQVCFNVRFYDNAEAGKSKNPSTDRAGSMGTIMYFLDSGRVENQVPRLYTDPFGEVRQISLSFHSINTYQMADVDLNDTTEDARLENVRTDNLYSIVTRLPAINMQSWESMVQFENLSIVNQNLYKDQLETFNETIAIELVPDEHIIVHRNLLELSRLMSPQDNFTLTAGFSPRALGANETGTTFFGQMNLTPYFGNTSYGFEFQYSLPSDYKSVIIYAKFSNTDLRPLLTINQDWASGTKSFAVYYA